MGIMLRVSGQRACFSRPELKVETITYDTMTPTAAKAILEAIYWKPEIRWVIDGILVINPIITSTDMVNRLKNKINPSKNNTIDISDSKNRDQRNITILKDVNYVIKAHFEILSGENNTGKHQTMFQRRAELGQYYRSPYFGCREYPVEEFELVSKVPESCHKGTMNFGYILHSIDYNTNQPAFFKAIMENGYIEIPSAKDPGVKR